MYITPFMEQVVGTYFLLWFIIGSNQAIVITDFRPQYHRRL